MKKYLLFNPPSALGVYRKSKVRAAVPKMPSLSLAMIAGALLEEGVSVKIADLTLADTNESDAIVAKEITQFKPDAIGVTATTPLFYEARQICQIAKSLSKDIVAVIGGPHASSLPLDSLRESLFDIAVVGEGETAIKAIARGGGIEGMSGIYTRKDIGKAAEEIHKTPEIALRDLPMPALHLFNTQEYICPKVIARNNPVGPIEMSRGCVFRCSFCNKTVFGRKFRIKDPERVIEELLVLKKLGYREFHVLDDQFTTEIDKAKEICERIIRSDIRMTWNLRTGVRVDKIDSEFLTLAKRAGCYQVGIGFESGDQRSLE